MLAGESVVLGDRLEVLAQSLSGLDRKPGRRSSVQPLAVAQQDGLVGDVPKQGVFEDELVAADERRVIASVDELSPASSLQCRTTVA